MLLHLTIDNYALCFDILHPNVYSFESTLCLRFILVDWMAEVSTLKGFTTQALSNAVAIVDQCLLRGCFSAQNLQLLAVVALVITSKLVTHTYALHIVHVCAHVTCFMHV